MDIRELKERFEREGVPESLYSLKGGLPNERYCMMRAYGEWLVYYSERGVKSGLKSFETEADACLYLYECVKNTHA